MRRAVVLLSGGLDSATVLAMAKAQGFECFALSFSYGQRHAVELDAAAKIAADFEVADHRVAQIDLRLFGGSALTADISVPKGRDMSEMGEGIPITYVPARNTIFLSFALAWAEVLGAHDIFIGVNALDYSGYPDCRPEYIAAFETMANLATAHAQNAGHKVTLQAPLIALSKAEIIKHGLSLGVDYRMTISCYDPDTQGHACGACDSCQLRQKGFRDAAIDDPTIYQEKL
ncbi:MAG: 7-cyano-7-deazaguanine synthase QueC [Rickettsiales bacterium]|nr:7-cyano-7-deazaguanine synthase QueC [Rickettsiales bacterium]